MAELKQMRFRIIPNDSTWDYGEEKSLKQSNNDLIKKRKTLNPKSPASHMSRITGRSRIKNQTEQKTNQFQKTQILKNEF